MTPAAQLELSYAMKRAQRPGLARFLLVSSTLLVAAATLRELRLEIGGLFVPLHVVPILFAAPLVFRSIERIPQALRTSMIVFLVLFSIAVLRYGEAFGDMVKMITSVVTIFAIALMVRTRRDFVYATVGLCVALLIANANGIRGGFVDYVGYRPLGEMSNKNGYSLYALPVVLLAAYVLVHFPTGNVTRGLLVATIVSSAFILFTGANRSGWGGMIVIGGVLALQARRWHALAVVGAVALLSYAAFTYLGSRKTFEHRMEQTTEGYRSDDVRMSLFTTSLEIALENPILGLTPQELMRELAKRLNEAQIGSLDTHNFIAYIVGGCGFPTMLALMAVGFVLWRRPPRASPQVRAANDLIRIVMLLFFVRGLFSREVFFVGPFPMALGLALGLMLVCEDEARQASAPQRAA